MTEWTVLVPVRRRDGKSRLGAGVPREALSAAMAADVVSAVTACRSVRRAVLVVADPDDVAWLAQSGLVATPATGSGQRPRAHVDVVVGGGRLNTDLAQAAAGSGDGTAVAVVMADLAAARTEDLSSLLDGAPATGRAVVADAPGTGTAVLLAGPGVPLRPRFGTDSFRRHLADGAVDLTASAAPTLRLDIDTPGDLELLTSGDVPAGPATTRLIGATAADAGAGATAASPEVPWRT